LRFRKAYTTRAVILPGSNSSACVTDLRHRAGTRVADEFINIQSRLKMPVKPNGALCAIKEQIVEDLASGLILQFECSNGRTRLVIAGRALPFGNREIIFDSDGREAAAGTLVGEFRRPSWLKGVP
jgi:hypothetical protein